MVQNYHRILSISYKVIFIIALIGITPMLGGVGTKLGLWLPMTGFRMTVRNYDIALLSFLILVFMSLKYYIKDRKQTIISYIVLLVFSSGAYYLGINKEPAGNGLPGIHDVTTDMQNPPEFSVLLNAPGRTNSFVYDEETAAKQVAKFPWVKPLITDLTPSDAYEMALQVAREMNWDIVGENPELGRFEATDYTKWFNFHDDVVVRIINDNGDSRIDLRSLSRVGGSDHGLGAQRIMDFQRNFNNKTQK